MAARDNKPYNERDTLRGTATDVSGTLCSYSFINAAFYDCACCYCWPVLRLRLLSLLTRVTQHDHSIQ